MENARPNEGQETTSETANEPHEEGEVRDDHGKEDGEDNDPNTKNETPNLQFAI